MEDGGEASSAADNAPCGADDDEERKTDSESGQAAHGETLSTGDHSQSYTSCSFDDGVDGSVPLFQASLATPATTLDDPAYIDLVTQLGRPGPVPETEEVALKKATRDNKAAYATWKKGVMHRSPDLQRVLQKVSDPAIACDKLIDHLPQLIELLGCLPFVPVLAGRERRCLFTDIGQKLLVLGRLHMLRRLSTHEDATPDVAQFCLDWITAIECFSTTMERLQMAQQQTRWTQLDHLLRLQPDRPIRSIPELPVADWGALLAHLLVSPSVVREQLADLDLGEASDVLMAWTAHDLRLHHTVLAATAFRDGHWLAPTEFYDDVVTLSHPPLPHGARAPSGGATQY